MVKHATCFLWSSEPGLVFNQLCSLRNGRLRWPDDLTGNWSSQFHVSVLFRRLGIHGCCPLCQAEFLQQGSSSVTLHQKPTVLRYFLQREKWFQNQIYPTDFENLRCFQCDCAENLDLRGLLCYCALLNKFAKFSTGYNNYVLRGLLQGNFFDVGCSSQEPGWKICTRESRKWGSEMEYFRGCCNIVTNTLIGLFFYQNCSFSLKLCD